MESREALCDVWDNGTIIRMEAKLTKWGFFLLSKISIMSHYSHILGLPCGSAGKKSACNGGDLGSIPGLGKRPGEGKGYLIQYSGLENSMDCIIHGVAKSQTRLSDFHFHFHSHVLH